MSSFLREAGTAVFLVTLTLCLQCAGMAALFPLQNLVWHRTVSDQDRSVPPLLMVRLMSAFIVLHISENLLCATFYRWLCFPLWESAF